MVSMWGWPLYRIFLIFYCDTAATNGFSQKVRPRNFTYDTPPPKKKRVLNLSLFIPGFKHGVILGCLSPRLCPTSFCKARSFSAERCSNISTCYEKWFKGGWKVGGLTNKSLWHFEGCWFSNFTSRWFLKKRQDNNQSWTKNKPTKPGNKNSEIFGWISRMARFTYPEISHSQPPHWKTLRGEFPSHS